MIDLDALEAEQRVIAAYPWWSEPETPRTDPAKILALIAELRASRRVVGFAQWVRDLPIADRQSPQREIETAIRLAAAALAELEAPCQ